MKTRLDNGAGFDLEPSLALGFPDGLTQTFDYNADGTLNYIEVTDGESSWRQTYSYESPSRLVGVSAWVPQ